MLNHVLGNVILCIQSTKYSNSAQTCETHVIQCIGVFLTGICGFLMTLGRSGSDIRPGIPSLSVSNYILFVATALPYLA